jgi:hypothetical protein
MIEQPRPVHAGRSRVRRRIRLHNGFALYGIDELIEIAKNDEAIGH